jgi:hypothetical protein
MESANVPIGALVNKILHISTMAYYSAIKKNKTMGLFLQENGWS